MLCDSPMFNLFLPLYCPMPYLHMNNKGNVELFMALAEVNIPNRFLTKEDIYDIAITSSPPLYCMLWGFWDVSGRYLPSVSSPIYC